MEGVDNVGVVQLLTGDRVHILGPGVGSHNDHRVGRVLPDGRQHLLGVGLDCRLPGRAVGLVANLIDNIGIVLVFRRHFGKKRYRVVLMGPGVAVGEDVPVYHHIHPQPGRRLYPFVHQSL